MIRRATVALLLIITMALAWALPATAAVSQNEKLAVLSDWTQTSAASYTTWYDARTSRDRWLPYGFDWSTDGCSGGPDRPLGFDFRFSCYRHDFGYRNYKAASRFPANKARLDSALYADLKRKCATYGALTRPACYSLAWTYYNAVKTFGSLAAVQQSDLERAARLNAANTP